MHIDDLAAIVDPATWRAVPKADPDDHPAGRWAIVAGDYAEEGEPDLYMEIDAENPKATAAYVIEAARRAARAQSVSPLDAATAARAELARTDTKAGILLAFSGTAFGVLAALAMLAATLPLPARIALGIAVALLAASSALALRVVRPTLPRSRAQATGVMAYAYATSAAEMPGEMADVDAHHAQDVTNLAKLARTKYRGLQLAVDLLLWALVAVGLAVSIAIGGWA